MAGIKLSEVIKILDERARREEAKAENAPGHPSDRAAALKSAANHFRALERKADGTVQLTEVIEDMEREIETNPPYKDVIQKYVDQLKLVDAL